MLRHFFFYSFRRRSQCRFDSVSVVDSVALDSIGEEMILFRIFFVADDDIEYLENLNGVVSLDSF
jgi:hypothetical protein